MSDSAANTLGLVVMFAVVAWFLIRWHESSARQAMHDADDKRERLIHDRG